MRLSLKSKIIVAVLLVIIFFGSLATISVFYYTKNILFEKEKNILETLSVQIAREVDQFLKQGSMLIESISQQDFSRYVLNENVSEEEFKEALAHLHRYNVGDIYSSLYIMNVSGDTVVSTDPDFLGKNYSFREYFKKTLEGSSVIDVVVGVTSKEIGYYFTQPIISEFGEIIGVAVAKMDPFFLHNILDTNNFEANIILADNDGVIIYSNEKELIYKTLGKLDKKTIDKIEEGRRFEGLPLNSAGYDIIKDNFLLEKNKAVEFYNHSNKERELFISTTVASDRFVLVLVESLETLIFSIQRIAGIVSFFVIVAALIALLVLVYLISYLLKPLTEIKSIAEQLSKGNYEVEIIDKENSDDLAKVINSFKKMIASIKKSRQEVENKVLERTKKLEKLNKFMVDRELKMLELKKEINDFKKNKNK